VTGGRNVCAGASPAGNRLAAIHHPP
jgi:hypothetical protein